MTTDTSAEALELLANRLNKIDCAPPWEIEVAEEAAATLRALSAEKRRAREGVTPIKHSEQQDDGSFSHFIVLSKQSPWNAEPSECIECATESDCDKCLRILQSLPDGRDAKDWTDEQCIRFMCIGLRHAEYSNGGPTVNEIRQGARAAMMDTDHD